jgi:hypothetical protein
MKKNDMVLVWVPKNVRNAWKANAAHKDMSLKEYLRQEFMNKGDDVDRTFERLKRGLF